MTNEIQERYKDGHWETMATTQNRYNADVILMALQTKWPASQFRVI